MGVAKNASEIQQATEYRRLLYNIHESNSGSLLIVLSAPLSRGGRQTERWEIG